MAVRIDLTGQTYGNTVVIKIAVDEKGKKKKWLCKCLECGDEFIASGSNLRSGHTKACKKCAIKKMMKKNITHGKTHTKIYRVWHSMINRCENPKNKSYINYGYKGINVCEEWKNPAKFIEWSYNNGYEEGLEIDRINCNGNYEPNNCRWITKIQNANNKTNNKFIEYEGQTHTLAEWSRKYDVNYKRLSRLLIIGYDLHNAINRIKTNDRTHFKSKKWKEIYQA